MSHFRSILLVVLAAVFSVFLLTSIGRAATNCSATFNQEGHVVIPYVVFGSSALSLELAYSGFDNCSYWFNVVKAEVLTDASSFSGCQGAGLSTDLKLHIPDLQLNGAQWAADLQYMPVIPNAVPLKLVGINQVVASNAADYVIGSGQTVNVTSDLFINASGRVRIDGTLAPPSQAGQSVSITAEGDIVIAGTVAAGNGIPGGPGGSLTLYSKNGNITIAETASIRAGDGANGVACTSNQNIVTAQGGNGGSITLRAPKGTLTLANKEGLLHIGNGGSSPAVQVQGSSLLTTAPPVPGATSPGNSGELISDAQSSVGLSFTSSVLAADLTDPATNAVLLPRGATIRVLTSSAQLSGGAGGSAAPLLYGVDENGNSTWPTAGARSSAATVIQEDDAIVVRGTQGGLGFRSGGDAGDVSASGPVDSPKTVKAYAGAGGGCLISGLVDKTCRPGRGGNATARGAAGPTAAGPGLNGFDGAHAEAYGGEGGTAIDKDSMDFTAVIWRLGDGGNAVAYGGRGGKGGGICPNRVIAYGGAGGQGGNARAFGGNTSGTEAVNGKAGNAMAYGGNGGPGGDGTDRAGSGGLPGTPYEAVGDPGTKMNGYTGASGSVCPVTDPPPLGKKCKCTDEGVTIQVVSGCSGPSWADAKTCRGFMSIIIQLGVAPPDGLFDSGSSFSAFNCTLKIICP